MDFESLIKETDGFKKNLDKLSTIFKYTYHDFNVDVLSSFKNKHLKHLKISI